MKPASFVWALEARLALPGDQNRYFVQGGLAFSSNLCTNYTSCPQSAEESHDDFPVPFSEGHFQVVSPALTYPWERPWVQFPSSVAVLQSPFSSPAGPPRQRRRSWCRRSWSPIHEGRTQKRAREFRSARIHRNSTTGCRAAIDVAGATPRQESGGNRDQKSQFQIYGENGGVELIGGDREV